MKNEILLIGKKILLEKSPLLLSYRPDENWRELWDDKGGEWGYENGYLIGCEPENKGGILLSKASFPENVVLSFTVKTVLPATRDLNAVFNVEWDDETNYLKRAYVVGVNGWYEEKSGIERFPYDELRVLTQSYHYIPGTEIRITTGVVEGHSFLMVDDELICEVDNGNNPIGGGRLGFSPYSTMLAIKDIEVREICWEPRYQTYTPEF